MSFVIELPEGEYLVEAVQFSGGPYEQYGKKEIFLADDTLQAVSLKLLAMVRAIEEGEESGNADRCETIALLEGEKCYEKKL